MSMSKAKQETAVGEGLAVGCLAIGVVSVTASKLTIELAFARAWQDWPSASLFPVVHTSLDRNDLPRILRASANRRSGGLAWWDCGREWVPVLADGYHAAEAGDALDGPTGVPLVDWAQLARDFVASLGEGEVRRDPLVAVDLEDDADDDDHEARGIDDDTGYGSDSYFARSMSKND